MDVKMEIRMHPGEAQQYVGVAETTARAIIHDAEVVAQRTQGVIYWGERGAIRRRGLSTVRDMVEKLIHEKIRERVRETGKIEVEISAQEIDWEKIEEKIAEEERKNEEMRKENEEKEKIIRDIEQEVRRLGVKFTHNGYYTILWLKMEDFPTKISIRGDTPEEVRDKLRNETRESLIRKQVETLRAELEKLRAEREKWEAEAQKKKIEITVPCCRILFVPEEGRISINY